MKKAIFLSVRNKAKRFPGKVLKDFTNGFNVTTFLISQLKRSKKADLVLLATSIHPDDVILTEMAKTNGISFFCGSEDDKLLRYNKAAEAFNVDVVAVVDGDDPFCSPEHIDNVFEAFEKESCDYVTYENLPLGASSFGVSSHALKKICQDMPERDTEVWGHLFANHPDKYKTKFLKEINALYTKPSIRLTLDYKEDYDFFVQAIQILEAEKKEVNFHNLMLLLEKKPSLISINKSVQELYENNIQKLKEAI